MDDIIRLAYDVIWFGRENYDGGSDIIRFWVLRCSFRFWEILVKVLDDRKCMMTPFGPEMTSYNKVLTCSILKKLICIKIKRLQCEFSKGRDKYCSSYQDCFRGNNHSPKCSK